MTSLSKAPSFGELQGLIGTWKGVKGWSLISVPALGLTGFKLIVQNYTEILTFKAVEAPVENKGGDINQNIGALEYEQRIHDFDTKELIHVENGMFLYMNDIIVSPDETIEPPFRVARSGTIPHGNSILLLGSVEQTQGAPEFSEISSLPSAQDQQGAPEDFFSQFVSEQDRLTVQDIVIKEPSKIFNVYNPNDNLVRDNKGLEVVNTTHVVLDSRNAGSVDNIPFIKTHANATSARSDFWLQTVKLPMSGKNFQQLQYSQNVGITFHKRFDNKPGLITWPHITINTLVKVD